MTVVGAAREITREKPRAEAPQWICGHDGQFVVANQHLWIAREGDLPALASQHSPRRVPLLQVAMFVVIDGPRRGQKLVRPALVGRDAGQSPVAGDSETVLLGAREFAELQTVAAREGIVVADLKSGCRIKPESVAVVDDGPRAEVLADVHEPVAEISLPAESVPVPSVEKAPAANHHVRPAADLPKRKLLADDAPKARDRHDATTRVVVDVATKKLSVEPPGKSAQTEISQDLLTGLEQVIARFGGVAWQRELARYAAGKWITHAAQRAETLKAITSRLPTDAVSWYPVGDTWVGIGGSTLDTKESLRRDAVAAALQGLGLTDGVVLDGSSDAERVCREVVGSSRFDRLVKSLGMTQPAARGAAPRREASKAKSKRSKADRRKGRDASAGTNKQTVAAPISAETPGIEIERLTVSSTVVPKRHAPARFGDKARVRVDIDGFRTVAVVDLKDWSVEVTGGELQGATFANPTSALNAVIERFAVGQSPFLDGLDHWLLDDASGRSLREMASQ